VIVHDEPERTAEDNHRRENVAEDRLIPTLERQRDQPANERREDRRHRDPVPIELVHAPT
jgi:hypothetical protein